MAKKTDLLSEKSPASIPGHIVVATEMPDLNGRRRGKIGYCQQQIAAGVLETPERVNGTVARLVWLYGG